MAKDSFGTRKRRVTHPFRKARQLAAQARLNGVKGATARSFRASLLREHRGR